MKNGLVATFAMTGVGLACAQSSVTVFGVLDAAVASYATTTRSAAGVESTSRLRGLINSGLASSRLGFRGQEDLGNGWMAAFWLESALSNDDGNASGLTFQRRSTVSLVSPAGELRLGRDYNPTFYNDQAADPFGQVGPGANLMLAASSTGSFSGNAANYARVNNSIAYFLPKGLGGLYGNAMVSLHENGSATNAGRTGRYVGARIGYAKGAFNVALAYATNVGAEDTAAGTRNDIRTTSLFASYDFGVLKVTSEFKRSKSDRSYTVVPVGGGERPVDFDGALLGAIVPLGLHSLRASYAQVRYDLQGASTLSPKATKLAIGYAYELSKRTALYVTAARVGNSDGASLTVGRPAPAFATTSGSTPVRSTGYAMGIRHAF